MSLLRFDEISLDFGELRILSAAGLSIEAGERVCLIGRNGAGKSTTLKLITGELEPDRGEIVRASNLVVSQLSQSLPQAMDTPVRDVVRSGLRETEALLAEYEKQSKLELDRDGLRELEALHARIDAHDGWHIEQRVDETITDLDLPADKRMNELSGGWRRRVALAQAIVQKPDLLLLDEPTNHLDIATIKWLEDRLYSWPGAVLFITHDRAFLQRLATRILEIDRAKLTSWPGNYDNFLIQKEKLLEVEEVANAKFDKKLAQEEEWIRQGIKARRTRNEGRARALKKMREERAQRVTRDGQARIHIEEAEQSGRKVIRAKKRQLRIQRRSVDTRFLNQDYARRSYRVDWQQWGRQDNFVAIVTRRTAAPFRNTETRHEYRDRLLRPVTANTRARQVSRIQRGRRPNLHQAEWQRPAYRRLPEGLPVQSETCHDTRQGIVGWKSAIASSWPSSLPSQPTCWSSTSQPMIWMSRHSKYWRNKLTEYNGTLIVVSHDREFLDNVVTSTVVFEDDGSIREYVGGYSDWLRQGHDLAVTDSPFEVAERKPTCSGTTKAEKAHQTRLQGPARTGPVTQRD